VVLIGGGGGGVDFQLAVLASGFDQYGEATAYLQTFTEDVGWRTTATLVAVYDATLASGSMGDGTRVRIETQNGRNWVVAAECVIQ
jgi:hypothetical protein